MTPTKDVGSLDQFQLAHFASKGAEPPLNGTDITVLLELIDRYKKKDGVTFPSSAGHLARETGRPIRSVQESLRRLQDIHLAQIVEQGTGTRGNTYTFNFEWVREVAAEIKSEVEARAIARKKRRSKKTASTAENRVASSENLPTRKSAPLRDIVTRKFAYLTGVPTLKSAPQTYGEPTGSSDRCAGTPPFGYATSGAAPLRNKDGLIDYRVFPDVEKWVTFTRVEQVDLEEDNSKCLTIFYVTDCGINSEIVIVTESDDAAEQQDGQAVLCGVFCAAGLYESEIETGEELLGRRAKLVLHYHNGAFVRSLQPHEYDDVDDERDAHDGYRDPCS